MTGSTTVTHFQDSRYKAVRMDGLSRLVLSLPNGSDSGNCWKNFNSNFINELMTGLLSVEGLFKSTGHRDFPARYSG